jgi:hypothetical protein
MRILDSIKRRYGDLLSPSISSYRDYISLKTEHRAALLGSIVSIAISIFITYFSWIGYRFELAFLLAVSGVLLSLYRVITRVSRALERRKGFVEELPFLVFMASVTAKTGVELIDALKFIAVHDRGGRVFKYFSSLSKRVINLSRYISIYDALESIAGTPRIVRKAFLNYVANIAQGTGIEALRSMGAEMIRESSRRISRIIDISSQGGLLAVMVMTTAPMLLLGISSIIGSYIALTASILITMMTPLIIIAIPSIPYPLRPIPTITSRIYIMLKVLAILALTGLYIVLFIPLLLPSQWLIRSSITLFIPSLLLIALGLVLTTVFISYIRSVEVIKDLLGDAERYVRVYRTLAGFEVDRYLKRARLSTPWLMSYIDLSIRFLMEKGEIDPHVFNRFSDEIGDILSKNVNRILVSLIPLSALLLQPIFLSQIMVMMHAEGLYTFLLSSVSILASSLIVSKVFFGEIYNTIIPGITTTIFFLISPLR